MNVDELQSVQSRERQTDQLQQLRATFYEEAGQFVAQLREERKRAAERADDPFDAPEVNHLTDDINTAEKTIEAIYERRVGKIVKMASLAAADMPTEDDGLTREERDLFETMVEAIKGNRNHVLDVVSGETPVDSVTDAGSSTPTESSATEDVPAGQSEATPSDPVSEQSSSGVGAADVMGGESEAQSPPPVPDDLREQDPQSHDSGTEDAPDRPADEAAAAVGTDQTPPAETPPNENEATAPGQEAGDDVSRRTVRITDDVGEIFGVDEREYDLSANDVVTLPRDNADPLVEKDAAEPLE